MSFALSPGMRVSWLTATVGRAQRLLGRFERGRRLLDVAGRLRGRLEAALHGSRPRILLLVDGRNWAQDNNAREIARALRREFHFDIRYELEKPQLRASRYDLAYVFFWGSEYYKAFDFDPERVIKGLSSHRWQDAPAVEARHPRAVVSRYFRDAAAVVCPSRRLHDLFHAVHPGVYHARKGYNPTRFRPTRPRSGPLTIGWAGNVRDSVKGFHDVVEPACRDRFRLRRAPGTVRRRAMNAFYADVDVLAVASRHEGDPLTLIEAMAAGCFPVCTDVGIAPELIRSGENGLIVEPTAGAFADAFAWCEANLSEVRRAGERNALKMARERPWAHVVGDYRRVFADTLQQAARPRFRNDDVSWDTALEDFRAFCAIFARYGLTQVHGVTLRGRTSTVFEHDGAEVAYEGEASISRLPNQRIYELSRGMNVEDRRDLVDYLRASADDIALHGLYHTDYSVMTGDEQRRDIAAGLELLDRLFPGKLVRYFIPPFNRANAATVAVCREFGLTVLTKDGVHLEEALHRLEPRPGTWHRYHHHRFYPSTKFTHYRLSLAALDAALGRAFAPIAEASDVPA